MPRMAAPHRPRRLLRHPEEEARADHCFGQRGTRPRLPHQRLGKPMKSAINDASARQRAGGPPPVPSRGGDWENRPLTRDIIEVEGQIAGLVDWSTQVYKWLGADCIASDRLRVSVAIC
jgi:hypothetical protein